MGRTCGKAEQERVLGTVRFEQSRPIAAHSVAGLFLLTKHPDHHMAGCFFLARLEGFEPPTYGLEVRCSIHLSYRRAVYLLTPGG